VHTHFRAALQQSEGFRSREYVDTVGKRTIGYGFNVSDRGEAEFAALVGRAYSGEVSIAEAVRLMDGVLAKTETELLARVPWIGSVALEFPVRYSVLLDMAYNMGVPTLLTFKATLAAVRDREYDLVASHMLKSKWARQVGRRADRLARQMETGVAA